MINLSLLVLLVTVYLLVRQLYTVQFDSLSLFTKRLEFVKEMLLFFDILFKIFPESTPLPSKQIKALFFLMPSTFYYA